MGKKLTAVTFFALTASIVLAQDMPPLPPLPDQGKGSSPASSSPAPAPAPAGGSTQDQALPPLPGDTNASTAPAATPATTDQSQALPPLPGDQSAAPTPAASTETSASTPAAESATPSETPEVPKKAAPLKPWQVSRHRPNVIFGGWVRAKGGNETSRLAWTSQEVLNALLFKKYKLINPTEGKPEEGVYEGQGGGQWRQFTFIAPKSKLQVQVYLRQSKGKKVWVRVGPGEGVFPDATSLSQAQKIRQADLTALHLIQKKFGHRLAPRKYVANWEAPYRYEQETADY